MKVRDLWNKIFWGMFIVIGIGFVFLALYGSLLFLDLLLGFAIITMGLHKLGEEYSVKTFKKDQVQLSESMGDISKWMQDSNKYLNELKELQAYNIKTLGTREQDIESQMEKNYRNLARKIIELENRLNEISNSFLKKTIVRSGKGK